MTRKKIIEDRLDKLSPSFLEVIDNSSSHAGHSGNPNSEDGTHFTIKISSEKLEGLNRVEQHRIINDMLKDEFEKGLHALSIKILSTQS